jgi:hypothetical protein
MADSLEELIERFRAAGCRDPESWARSEINEGIAQFARFIFLRELWKCALPQGSRAWISSLELPNDDGRGGALRRLKESTASIDDLGELVRAAQVSVVRDVAFMLDGYAPAGDMVEDVNWGLFELDANGRPAREIGGLHESIEDDECQP